MLRQSGPDAYDQWYQGKLKWSSPEIKKAWQTWGQIATGSEDGLRRQVVHPVDEFRRPQAIRCSRVRRSATCTSRATSSRDFFVKDNPDLKPVDGYNFFLFPDIDTKYPGTIEVGGDLFGMFRTAQSRALIKYLTTPEAQAIWVKRGGALSPNKRLAPERLSRPGRHAGRPDARLRPRTVRFDAS